MNKTSLLSASILFTWAGLLGGFSTASADHALAAPPHGPEFGDVVVDPLAADDFPISSDGDRYRNAIDTTSKKAMLNQLASDPVNSDGDPMTVYVIHRGQVLHSNDGGETWSLLTES